MPKIFVKIFLKNGVGYRFSAHFRSPYNCSMMVTYREAENRWENMRARPDKFCFMKKYAHSLNCKILLVFIYTISFTIHDVQFISYAITRLCTKNIKNVGAGCKNV